MKHLPLSLPDAATEPHHTHQDAGGLLVQRFGALLDVCLPAPGGLGQAALARDDVVAALCAQIAAPPADTDVILIRAPHGGFGLGAMVTPAALGGSESFAALLRGIDASPVPVAILCSDAVEGAAAELALACHLRIAGPQARLWFSAFAMGLVGAAGSTQRLPRLTGAEVALSLLSRAGPVGAAEALVLGAVDHVIDEADPKVLVALARAALAKVKEASLNRLAGAAAGMAPDLPAPVAAFAVEKGLTPPARFLAEVAQARAGAKEPRLRDLVDCVEAALLLPPDVGLAFERARMADWGQSPLAAALEHLARQERRPQLPASAGDDGPIVPITAVGVAGHATWLAGPVRAMLQAGLRVVIATTDAQGGEAGAKPLLEAIARDQEKQVQARRITAAARDADWARLQVLSGAAAIDALREMPVIISTAGAVLPAPERRRAVLHLGPGAVPDGAFRLILRGKLAEIAPPAVLRVPAARRALQVMERIGRVVVFVSDGSGAGLSTRLAQASEAAVAALRAMGVAGGDISAALAPLGQKIPADGAENQAGTRPMAADEIRDRWLWALVGAGLAAQADGLLTELGQIDLAAVHSLGMPRDCGGPMHQADLRGALLVRRDLQNWAKDAPVWAAHPALDALVSAGRGFAGARVD